MWEVLGGGFLALVSVAIGYGLGTSKNPPPPRDEY